MIRNIKYCTVAVLTLLVMGGCKKKEYSMGSLAAPTDLVLNTTIVGQGSSAPNGDGSGNVIFQPQGKNVIAYKIDYDASDGIKLETLSAVSATKKYTKLGLNSYTVTLVGYGPGGETSAQITKTIQVQSDFTPPESLVTSLVGTGTKVWKLDKNASGHFGVGPWSPTSLKPEWWSASPNEKANDVCFYSARFSFTKNANGTYSMAAVTPNGAFTKTGALAGLPGIPATGPEACYTYAGGTSTFTLVPPGSGVAASSSTGVAILLAGTDTFIGYGAVGKEYEILSISDTNMYLRVQGTETGNAWYLKLIPE
jgi:hypothetical protein